MAGPSDGTPWWVPQREGPRAACCLDTRRLLEGKGRCSVAQQHHHIVLSLGLVRIKHFSSLQRSLNLFWQKKKKKWVFPSASSQNLEFFKMTIRMKMLKILNAHTRLQLCQKVKCESEGCWGRFPRAPICRLFPKGQIHALLFLCVRAAHIPL